MAGPQGRAWRGYEPSPINQAISGAWQNVGQSLERGVDKVVAGKLRGDEIAREDEKIKTGKRDQAFQLYNTELAQERKEYEEARAMVGDSPDDLRGVDAKHAENQNALKTKYSTHLPELGQPKAEPTIGSVMRAPPAKFQDVNNSQASPDTAPNIQMAPRTIGDAMRTPPKSYAEYSAGGKQRAATAKDASDFEQAKTLKQMEIDNRVVGAQQSRKRENAKQEWLEEWNGKEWKETPKSRYDKPLPTIDPNDRTIDEYNKTLVQSKPGLEEVKNRRYAQDLDASLEIMAKLRAKGYDPSKQESGLVAKWAREGITGGWGKNFAGDNATQYAQAVRQIVTAKLRKESGAAISPEEFTSAYAEVIPTYGDDPGTVAQKYAAIEREFDTVIDGTGFAKPGNDRRLTYWADGYKRKSQPYSAVPMPKGKLTIVSP